MAGPGKPGPLTKEEALERKAAVWRMRVEAKGVGEIAEHFGISRQRVTQLLQEHGQEIAQPAAEELRKVELDKLDDLERAARAVIARHTEHDDPMVLAAADRILKIGQRRAALVGLDAPTQVETRAYEYRVNGVDTDALK